MSPDFPWGAVVSLATAVGGGIAVILIAALRESLRRDFASKDVVMGPDGQPRFLPKDEAKESFDLLHKRIDTNKAQVEAITGLFRTVDDRAGAIEERLARMEERQTQQWGRVSESLANTARTNSAITRKQEEMGRMLSELAIRIERIQIRP